MDALQRRNYSLRVAVILMILLTHFEDNRANYASVAAGDVSWRPRAMLTTSQTVSDTKREGDDKPPREQGLRVGRRSVAQQSDAASRGQDADPISPPLFETPGERSMAPPYRFPAVSFGMGSPWGSLDGDSPTSSTSSSSSAAATNSSGANESDVFGGDDEGFLPPPRPSSAEYPRTSFEGDEPGKVSGDLKTMPMSPVPEVVLPSLDIGVSNNRPSPLRLRTYRLKNKGYQPTIILKIPLNLNLETSLNPADLNVKGHPGLQNEFPNAFNQPSNILQQAPYGYPYLPPNSRGNFLPNNILPKIVPTEYEARNYMPQYSNVGRNFKNYLSNSELPKMNLRDALYPGNLYPPPYIQQSPFIMQGPAR